MADKHPLNIYNSNKMNDSIEAKLTYYLMPQRGKYKEEDILDLVKKLGAIARYEYGKNITPDRIEVEFHHSWVYLGQMKEYSWLRLYIWVQDSSSNGNSRDSRRRLASTLEWKPLGSDFSSCFDSLIRDVDIVTGYLDRHEKPYSSNGIVNMELLPRR